LAQVGSDGSDKNVPDLEDVVDAGHEITIPEVLGKRITQNSVDGSTADQAEVSDQPGRLAQTGFSILLFLGLAFVSLGSGQRLARRPAAA
jgi:hypothetical protein